MGTDPVISARHIIVGVSHPSNDPAQHRVFEIRAVEDAAEEGWIAEIREQNLNAQPDDWPARHPDHDPAQPFPSAGACLGHAVEGIVALVAGEAED